MAHYMLQVAYRPQSWRAQIERPENVVERIRGVTQSLGGSVEATFYSFGTYDLVQIVELPDNVSAAALSMIGSAGGAVRSFHTTPLLAVEEGMEALRKAKESRGSYKAPAG